MKSHGCRARLPHALVALLGLTSACVDLTRPSVADRCALDGQVCRSDAGSPEAGADLKPRPDLGDPNDAATLDDAPGPEDVSPADEVTPPGDVVPPVDEAPDPPDGPTPDSAGTEASQPEVSPPEASAPDLPRDLPPDLQLPVDLPPDVTVVDVPVPVVKGVCPTGESSLLLCLRFEGSLADEAPPPAAVTSNSLSYEAGPSELAVRVGAASVIRASQGWGNVGTTFTLEVWIRPDRLPTGSQRMGLVDDETRFGMFILPGGNLACYFDGIAATAPAAVRAGQWTAVTCTASSTTLTAWVDGLQRSQTSLDGVPGGANTNLAIGSNNPSGDAFEGLMDNLRVWNTVRTGAQICQASLGCP